jgi:hypothetical protein
MVLETTLYVNREFPLPIFVDADLMITACTSKFYVRVCKQFRTELDAGIIGIEVSNYTIVHVAISAVSIDRFSYAFVYVGELLEAGEC